MRGVALVTGAARRIGRSLALAAAEAGYDLAIHHRSHPQEADSLAAEAAAFGVAAVAAALGRAAGALVRSGALGDVDGSGSPVDVRRRGGITPSLAT